jgi:exodeoxyribonuclease VII large subunit
VTANPPPEPGCYTVTELTREIKALLEANFQEVKLRGEVSNLRRQSSGHLYFSLKDKHASISCVCFRADAMRLKVQLRDGLQILGIGRINVYEPRGNYQVIFRVIEEDGIGRLQQAFLELKEKLSREGLFDPQRKQPLPKLPATIGFVTSESGAALRDFISILRRRQWSGRLIVIPARVQGPEAAPEIVRGIELANTHSLCDLLVIGRGGGSLEDLWPFNEESVARAVAASRLPVISAVGHEIDFTLSDFAADFRAETPSAAAEWITSAHQALLEKASVLDARFREASNRHLERLGHRLSLASLGLRHQHPRNRIDQSALRLDDLQGRLEQVLQFALGDKSRRVQLLQSRFTSIRPKKFLDHNREKLRQIGLRLINNSHQATLRRGYAIIRGEQQAVVSDANEVPTGGACVVEMRDGQFEAIRKKPSS